MHGRASTRDKLPSVGFFPVDRAVSGALDGMHPPIPPTLCDRPNVFTSTEREEFEAFVVAGGEVESQGLGGRILRAHRLAVTREAGCLLAVAGLKIPENTYLAKVSMRSGVELSSGEFSFELGWVFVHPSARGRRLSFPLCNPLVSAAEGKGILATSHTNKEYMHRTLKRLGFERSGQEWESTRDGLPLALFLRHAV